MGDIKHTAEIVNRKVRHEYFIVQEFEAGLALQGTEVKSLRKGNANMVDAYCTFEQGELVVRNLHISEYELGTHYNHEPKRTRKLLLRKSELQKIFKRVTEKGMTVVPYRIYFNERGFAKMEIVLAQGKKAHDKRNSIKEKDSKRQMEREKKAYI